MKWDIGNLNLIKICICFFKIVIIFLGMYNIYILYIYLYKELLFFFFLKNIVLGIFLNICVYYRLMIFFF